MVTNTEPVVKPIRRKRRILEYDDDEDENDIKNSQIIKNCKITQTRFSSFLAYFCFHTDDQLHIEAWADATKRNCEVIYYYFIITYHFKIMKSQKTSFELLP